ncbi:MAG: hypothetical protein A2651_00425 [Candidatus Yanofskybacteria bacterium RIFCSPHIGHO2_01_FULL_42_12]|uniref:Sulfatase N-terminal domain-containing protein n=1 Tax=Candidatus Yanofskybacteria bacterium RIFCSPLOWO2_01_FULL_42_49 TaxID=1802694 RepID=A0A1F8GBR7_9BACT|nr:MAG: hypothetical protein A2651_00425 [Candidatus Yanofskybacteria bacterium RIFCSPHIGHO2_01_FULL_42_12]OGN22168.1 MAG: hypothetical protein A2918_03345 [Candidatus Yanofskybacteria bacterium RIFCSPLOWO2_01_FULL_42_49]
MIKIKDFIKNIPYLPLLYGIFPILFLFAHNISELKYEMLWLPLFIVTFIVLVFTIILSIFVKDYIKSGLILSLFFIVFLSYGNFKELLLSVGWLIDIGIVRDKYLYPLGIFSFISASYFIMRSKDLGAVYKFFRTAGFALIAFSFVSIGFSAYSNSRSSVVFEDGAVQTGLNQDQNLPDIYYIVPDSYARVDILKEVHNYDNSEFINFLKKKGFSVLSKNHSNYQNTVLSIPATMNMDYLDNLLPETIEKNDIANLIHNNRVQQFLKAQGYKIIQFDSGLGITSYNKYADIRFNPSRLNNFSHRIIETSLLKYFVSKRQFFGFSINNEERKRILYSFEKLKEIPELDVGGPKFVFLHLFLPHPPFLFDRNGEEVNVEEASILTEEEYGRFWLDQLIFANKQLSLVVDEILAKSKTEPIIIIQSDHGYVFWMNDLSDRFFELETFTTATRASGKNFSALYLPGGKKTLLPDNLTNVNTFRFIFKNYFNADYDLLEDKIYKYYDYLLLKNHSDFKNIKQVPWGLL